MPQYIEKTFSLDLTDDEFVRLHAAASSEGLEINDFIVATLRKHAAIISELQHQQEEDIGGAGEDA